MARHNDPTANAALGNLEQYKDKTGRIRFRRRRPTEARKAQPAPLTDAERTRLEHLRRTIQGIQPKAIGDAILDALLTKKHP